MKIPILYQIERFFREKINLDYTALILDELKILKNDTQLIFKYLSNLDLRHRDMEREVVSDYRDVKADHLVRYLGACKFINAKDSVLDFACGCGYGASCIKLNSHPQHIVAADIDANAIKFAKIFFGNQGIEFCKLDICDLDDFQKESFSKIVSFETIEHVPNDLANKALENIYEWLKPNGQLICSVPNQDIVPYDRDVYRFHFRHYTVNEMKELLQSKGFKDIQVFYTDLNNIEIVKKFNKNCNETIFIIANK